MPIPMSRAEKAALPTLGIRANPTDRISLDRPGENPTRKIDKYRPEEALSKGGAHRTSRTDRSAKFILQAASLGGGVAPYAFMLPNGDPSSLDWWVISVLKNKGEIDFVTDINGLVTGVTPTIAMRRRYGDYVDAIGLENVDDDIRKIDDDLVLTATERLAELLCRIGQGAFRRDLMSRFNGRCAVTKCDVPQLLRASHIVAWAADETLRRDPENGLLLVSQIDSAFDAHLISFEDDGSMSFSQRLPEPEAREWGIHGSLTTQVSERTKSYLARHRARCVELDGLA